MSHIFHRFSNCREIELGSATVFLWLLNFLTLTSSCLFLPLEAVKFNFTEIQEAKMIIFQKVFLWRCSAKRRIVFNYATDWELAANLKILWLMSTHSLLFCSHNKRDSFSGNVVQNMHVNDDHSIAPSFTSTLVVSKSKWQNWPKGPYALLSAWAISPINQHLPLRAQKIPTDNYLHCKPFVLQTCSEQRNILSKDCLVPVMILSVHLLVGTTLKKSILLLRFCIANR